MIIKLTPEFLLPQGLVALGFDHGQRSQSGSASDNTILVPAALLVFEPVFMKRKQMFIMYYNKEQKIL